ncbi:MAG TPA: alanine racemase [Geminicoccaceae bacterium]|nr:alanine racemase [Geminicoccaceae bacterium]
MPDGSKAVLTIDLGGIVENFRRLQRTARGSEIAAVVKADAYGLGAARVARALAQAGCKKFFVAHGDEGLALREVVPDAGIYVLHGLPGEELAAIEAGLIPVLNHPGELERQLAHARRRGRLPAALHVDSGMWRLGFAEAELRALDATTLHALELRLVMSHLACAEEPGHPMNELQRLRFERQRALLPGAPASLANSSGIFLGEAYHHQLCRAGVALYGVNPTPGRANPMAPVVTLEAPVLQVYEVDAEGTVGYGATYPVRAGARLATVPVGYADGFLRAAGGRAVARIGGTPVPLAGRVSMDLLTLDVSALPAGAVRHGTMAQLIGGPDGLDELAAAAGTIGYEVLTRLGTRFARSYIGP